MQCFWQGVEAVFLFLFSIAVVLIFLGAICFVTGSWNLLFIGTTFAVVWPIFVDMLQEWLADWQSYTP